MTSRHPGAPTPEEILAHIDGEAPPRVREHLRGCAECDVAAQDYARARCGLRARLHRFDCPPSQRLGDYEFGLLPPEERTVVAAHVVDCPRCADELRQLRDFLAAEPAAPPVGAVERARRLIATLVTAAPLQGLALAGLRGPGDETTRTYRADDITISVSLGPAAPGGGGGLGGLVWREGADPEAIAGGTVTLTAADGTADTAEIDDLGGFTFDAVAPGAYRLEIALGEQLITIEGLHVGSWRADQP